MVLQYTMNFITDLDCSLLYIKYNLGNEIASNNLEKRVEKEILKRFNSPTLYTIYKTPKNNSYYKLHIRNYIIFYTVTNEVMSIRRFLYNRRDFDKIDVIS